MKRKDVINKFLAFLEENNLKEIYFQYTTLEKIVDLFESVLFNIWIDEYNKTKNLAFNPLQLLISGLINFNSTIEPKEFWIKNLHEWSEIANKLIKRYQHETNIETNQSIKKTNQTL